MELVARAVWIGVGATLVMDAWGQLLRVTAGVRPLNYALLGRWLGHLPRGVFTHQNIAAAQLVRGELVLGWCAHYCIGVTFALLLLLIAGVEWARRPTLLPALLFGIVTVVAPYFILQPGLGFGIAGAKLPEPNVARLKSLLTHTVYGVGLYLAARVGAAFGR